MDFQTVFGPSQGGPSQYYRIPSLINAPGGVLIACADARYCSGMDNPNRIDKVVRRSLDCGKTWEPVTVAVREHGNKQLRSSAAIDPVMVYSSRSGRVIMIYSHTPAGVGIRNSKKSRGEDESGARFVNGRFSKYILKSSRLYKKNGGETPYLVDDNGDVSKGGRRCGNIYTGGAFKEEHTSYLMLVTSDDLGKTWSAPRSLNFMVKEPFMSFIGPGPGCGIEIKQGKYAGRLVVPVYFGTRKFPLRLSCAVIYSDDGGDTWKMGKSPNDTREINGKTASIHTVRASEMLTESQLIEQQGGRLKYFIRNHDKRRSVAVAYSDDGGETWRDFNWDDSLPQPICQMSVISLGGGRVLFVNPASRDKRENGTVRLSLDDGESFPHSRLLKPGGFVYSAAAQMENGDIGVLFEPNTDCKEILFASFSPEWVTGGEKDI